MVSLSMDLHPCGFGSLAARGLVALEENLKSRHLRSEILLIVRRKIHTAYTGILPFKSNLSFLGTATTRSNAPGCELFWRCPCEPVDHYC